jgi:hypothetical protein
MGVCGCSDATPVVSGDDPVLVDQCQPGGTNGGHRWQDLYACYFGPSGQASCAARSGCHGASIDGGPGDLGSKASSFVCGPSVDACWQGMTKNGPVPKGGTADWTTTTLYVRLAKPDGSGNMPRMPCALADQVLCPASFVFQRADLDRIAAWIQVDNAADN